MQKKRAHSKNSRAIKSPLFLTKTPLWEKLIGLAGFMLFCCMVFFLLYSALNNHKRPPDFNFEIVGTEQLGDRFLVFVDINNTGDSTAAELHIEMRLTSDAGDVESSVAVIDYLPASSTQRIGLYFSSDPALSQLEFRPMGYQEP